MANRFLETNYYKSPFVRGLKGSLKSLYSFIICDCTASGIWALDMEAASLYIGFSVTFDEFCQSFVEKGKAIDLGNGKYFFPDFIEHQYPKGLSEKSTSHINIIPELKKLGLIDENNRVIKAPKKPLQRDKGYGYGIGNDLGQGNGNGEENKKKLIIPEMCDVWYNSFSAYTKDKESDFDGMGKILQFILKNGNETDFEKKEVHVKVLNTIQLIADEVSRQNFWVNKPIKSIANHIQEFYNNIKNPIHKNGTKSNGTHIGEQQQLGTSSERIKALKKW